MRRVDLLLGWISLGGGAGALFAVAWTAQWISAGALLGVVMLVNAAARFRLALTDAASAGPRPDRDGLSPSTGR